jgi:hypothetical protein
MPRLGKQEGTLTISKASFLIELVLVTRLISILSLRLHGSDETRFVLLLLTMRADEERELLRSAKGEPTVDAARNSVSIEPSMK